MAAELRLGVSFDLVYFRQQLGKLSQIAASEFTAPIKIKLDRRVIDRELNELQRLFARREYRININDSAVEAASLRIDALQNKISTLRNNVKNGIVVKVKYQEEGSFAAGKTGAAGLYEYMRTQGLSGGNAPGAAQAGRRTQFEAAVARATNAELKNMLQRANVSGRSSLRTGAAMRDRLRQLDDAAMESVLGNLEMRMREPRKVERSFLDKVARAVFWMAGVDPEYLKQQAAQRRALPNVSFPATVPPGPPIGPSSTGRALPPGAIPGALLGTAFGRQRFLPPQIGQDLNKILRNAAFAFVDSLNARIRQVNVREIGRPALPPSMIRGLLPSAVGRTPSMYGGPAQVDRGSFIQQRIAEAYARSAARGATVMGEGPSGGVLGAGGSGAAGPYRPFAQPPRGGAIVPYQAPSRGGGGNQGRGVRFGFSMQDMPSSLPGQGLIREMGDEFGFAAKQVLLFGSAYKALAVVTNFPAQVTEAVSALQNFRNTLTAVTPSSEEFRASSDLILGLVEKYNIPLQSARDGFTKLYASMEPAGFSGGEIRELFTGISKAAATFGMSADKVDRVNYAFAQMASKGQVMSEELKGQLGDVLPGAMSIFTEAAGFEGPNAISEFSQALEDGAYKGEAMKVLLTNVGTIMNKEFGPGAEGAARTFQGAMNRMQNSMKLLYETFEPVAVGFLNSVVTPFSNGIKTLTDGLNSFFTGAAAKTTGGFAIATELEKLRSTFEGIQKNAAETGKQLLELAKVGLELGKIFLQIAGNPIIGYLAKLYLIFLPLNTVLTVARGLWASNAIQLAIFNARIATGTSTLTAFRGMMAATGATAKTTGIAIRTAGIALKTFFSASGVGLVLVGLSMLIEKFMSMNQALADTRAKALGAAQAIRSMSQTEAQQEERRAQSGVRLIELLQARGPSYAGGEHVSMSAQEGQQLRDLGIPVDRTIGGGFRASVSMLPAYKQRLETVNIAEAQSRRRQIEFEDKQAQAPSALAAIPAVAGEEDGKGEKLKQYIADASRLYQKEKERELLAVEDRMLRKEISETEAKNLEALINKTYDILAVEEALRVARIEINNEKMSAADKTLKIADLEKEKLIELDNINKRYGIETLKTQLQLQKPLEDAIRGVNKEITRQNMLSQNLSAGIKELTIDQKAALDVQELTKDLTDAERKSVEKLIDSYRRRREEYYKNEEILKRQQLLGELQDRIGIAQSPFGEERITGLMQEGYDRSFAEGVDALEQYAEKAERIKQSFKDLEGSIRSSLGAAITDVLTDFNSMNDAVMRLRESVAGAFKQMADMIIQEMLRAAVHWAVKQLFSFMAPNLQGPAPAAPSAGMVFAANGGVMQGGWTPFASGGLVTGPTLGLVGEGRFNEAVVPLPNGKSIPVDLGGGAGNNISTNIVVNMNNGQASSQSSGRGGQALGREIEGAVRNVILKETRPGGLIYGAR